MVSGTVKVGDKIQLAPGAVVWQVTRIEIGAVELVVLDARGKVRKGAQHMVDTVSNLLAHPEWRVQ